MFEAKPQPADATGEDGHAREENPTAPKQVAQGAPDENQRTQEQAIRLDHPLHIHHRCVKATLYRRQSDIDDCAVDECHAGTENRCGENPSLCSLLHTGLRHRLIEVRLHRKALSWRLWMLFGMHWVRRSIRQKLFRIIAIFEHSGPEVLMREMLRSPRNPLLGV